MKKILIVEDELAYLKLLDSKLTASGYKVIRAMDGEEGLKLAKSENPDLILLDIRLPVMDGLVMLNLLRKTKSGKKTRVIMLTNIDPDEKILKEMVKNKPLYYFVKSDIQFDSLLDKVKVFLTEKL